MLGYHGCDQTDGERILRGEDFRPSANDYDWLGPGIYFWETNPERALEFAREKSTRRSSNIRTPFAVGAIIDLGLYLDLATKESIDILKTAYSGLKQAHEEDGSPLPRNGERFWERYLDCAVINHLHQVFQLGRSTKIDTVKGIFVEGQEIYPTSGFREKTHIQIAVCNPDCIKGVFRVPEFKK